MDDPPNSTPAAGERDSDLATVGKTLMIYTALGRAKTPMYLHDIESKSGLPRRTVQRHLEFLESHGWVQRVGAGRYMLTPGTRLPLGTADHEGIDRILTEFTETTGRDVALASLSGERLVFSHRHPSPKGVSLLEGIDPLALHATGSGKCLLAQLPSSQERRRLMLLTGMPRYTERTITDPEELEADLAAQEDELWSARGEYRDTGACLAILAHPGGIYGGSVAITTSVAADEFEQAREQLAAALHQAVARMQPYIGPLLPPTFKPRTTTE